MPAGHARLTIPHVAFTNTPVRDARLASLDATAQAELVRRRDVTARELVDAAIARIEHVSIHGGRGVGARFMKKNGPCAPFGYRFMTIARSTRCGRRTAEISA